MRWPTRLRTRGAFSPRPRTLSWSGDKTRRWFNISSMDMKISLRGFRPRWEQFAVTKKSSLCKEDRTRELRTIWRYQRVGNTCSRKGRKERKWNKILRDPLLQKGKRDSKACQAQLALILRTSHMIWFYYITQTYTCIIINNYQLSFWRLTLSSTAV